MQKLKRLHEDLNAYTFKFEESLLEELRVSYFQEITPLLQSPNVQTILGGIHSYFQSIEKYTSEYFLASFGKSPILWLSSYSDKTYQIYRRFFDNIGIEDDIKQLIDYQDKVIVYCGFLVLGVWSQIPNFHYDHCPNANAFTLNTPLFELNPKHGHLAYTLKEKAKIYEYSMGEGIIIGDNFLHCTEPFQFCGNIRVLASMSFGTDKLEYWDLIGKTAEGVGSYIMLPCGHVKGQCNCLEKHGLKKHHFPHTNELI